MPNISYQNPPGTGTLSSGASPTGTDISENWYFPTAAGDKSLEIINGHLDENNLDNSFKFNNRHLQHDSISRSKNVGCTANIDFFGKIFGGAETFSQTGFNKEPTDSVLSKEAIIVPGLALKFYNPFDSAKCVLQWNFNQQNDGTFFNLGEGKEGFGKNFPAFFLFIDDVMDPANARRFVPGSYRQLGEGVDYQNGRYWTGHKLIKSLSKGWHTASIRIVIPNSDTEASARFVNQCRVRTRGMRYIIFK